MKATDSLSFYSAIQPFFWFKINQGVTVLVMLVIGVAVASTSYQFYKRTLQTKTEQIIINMVQLQGLDSVYNVDPKEIRDDIEKIKQNFELLLSFEDINLEPNQELEKTLTKIIEIEGLELDSADIQAMEIKAEELYGIVNSLLELSNKYQEFYSNDLLRAIKYWSNRIEGIGKRFEMRSLINTRADSDFSSGEEIRYINLLAEFVEKYSETHTEVVIEFGRFAQQLMEAKNLVGEPTMDEWQSQSRFYRKSYLETVYQSSGKRIKEKAFVDYKRGEERFVKSALLTLKRIEIESAFTKLIEQWRRETYTVSSTTKLTKHPAYQQIIAMGNTAIPLLLKELERKPAQWFMALKAISGEDPVPPEFRGRTQEMIKAWLEWGRIKGYKW